MTLPDSPRPHIVVVDDEADLCELIALRLEHHGFRVSTERASRGAIEILEREVVDAMLVDLRLEAESGLDLLAEVQTRSGDLPVIILTAHGTIDSAVEAMKAGAYGFLTKPFDDRELVQKLEHAVESVRLRREVAGLRRVVGDWSSGDRLFGTSESIATVRELIARIAPSDATVLLMGESGTGKEVAARFIHSSSPRREGPFVAMSCGAVPPELLERELFGFRGEGPVGGSDDGGVFATAEGGTLFLDEIGDAPQAVQVKLLRVLQERSYVPAGTHESRRTDVRVIAATNRDLRAAIDAGRFREDLFYRLHVVPIAMPPLRERGEDIPLLAELFLTRAAAHHGLTATHLSHEAVRILMQHDWPGNVRELANVIEGAALLTTDGLLKPSHVLTVMPRRAAEERTTDAPVAAPRLPIVERILDPSATLPSLREARETFDRAYLEEALRRAGGNVSAAAKMSGRNRTDFHDLLRRYEINASDFRG